MSITPLFTHAVLGVAKNFVKISLLRLYLHALP